MDEKELVIRIEKLKIEFTKAQNDLQRLQQAVGQTQIRIVDLAARINELEEQNWKEKPSESVKVPEPKVE